MIQYEGKKADISAVYTGIHSKYTIDRCKNVKTQVKIQDIKFQQSAGLGRRKMGRTCLVYSSIRKLYTPFFRENRPNVLTAGVKKKMSKAYLDIGQGNKLGPSDL